MALALGCETALPEIREPGAIDAYRQEIAQHPKGPTSMEARSRLEQAEFERARANGSVLALRAFLSEFGQGPHRHEAQALLEAARWLEADKQGTREALQGYLVDEPAGAHAAEAYTRLGSLELDRLLKTGTSAELLAWREAHPKHPRLDEATAAQSDRAYEEAKGAHGPVARGHKLTEWLRDNPNSARRAEALAVLDDAELGRCKVLEDVRCLRALAQHGGAAGETARQEADALELAMPLARLDLDELKRLRAHATSSTAARLDAIFARLDKLPVKSGVIAAAQTLYLPAPTDPVLPQEPLALLAGLAAMGRSADGRRVQTLLSELSSPNVLREVTALSAVRNLLQSLPAEEREARAELLRHEVLPKAEDGPFLLQVSILAHVLGDEPMALAYGRRAASWQASRVVSLVWALELEEASVDTLLDVSQVLSHELVARLAVQRSTVDQLAKSSPGVPAGAKNAESGPSWTLLSLCGFTRAAQAGLDALEKVAVTASNEAELTKARSAAAGALAQAKALQEETERTQNQRGLCDSLVQRERAADDAAVQKRMLSARLLGQLLAEQETFAKMPAKVGLAGAAEVVRPALDRALAREPDAQVRGELR